MKLTSIGGIALSTYHLDGTATGIPRGLPGPDRAPNTLERVGAPALVAGIRRGVRPIPVDLYLNPAYTTGNQADRVAELWLRKFLGALNIDREDALSIQCQIDTDGDNVLDTTVEALGVPGPWQWKDDGSKAITITFYGTSPFWASTGASFSPVSGVYTANASPFTLAMVNSGEAVARPLIGICMATGGQRVTSTSTVGWTYRQKFAVTNNSLYDWHNELGTLILGDTGALVTGAKARSDGNDLRVRVEGKELPRTLTNWNTKYTHCHIPLTIPAGTTVTYEVIYGNPNAGAPATLDSYTVVNGAFCLPNLFGDNGTASAGTTTTLTDGTKAWPVNALAGSFVRIVAGTQSGTRSVRRIVSNTPTVLTLERALAGAPDATSAYVIWTTGPLILGGSSQSTTANTLTDSQYAWATNELVGATATIETGTGSPMSSTIVSNTPTAFTVSPNWPTTPDQAIGYRIERNGYHDYYVLRTDWTGQYHRGGFQINTFHANPSDMDLDSAHSIAGWARTTLVANNDDFAQASYTDYGPLGGFTKWVVGTLYASRRRASARLYAESAQADALALDDPRGFLGIRFDYNLKNQNSASGATQGIGKFVAGSRDNGTAAWQWFLTDTTKQNSGTAAVAYYDLSGTPPHLLCMGAIPNDEVAIAATASTNDEIRAEWATRLEVAIDASQITYGAAQAEESIYDLNGIISSLYSATPGPNGDVLVFGGPGHYVHLRTDQVLWVDCDAGLVYLTGGAPISLAGGFVFQSYCPGAAVVQQRVDDVNNDGVFEPKTSAAWMPMPPGNTTWTYTEVAVGRVEVQFTYHARYLG